MTVECTEEVISGLVTSQYSEWSNFVGPSALDQASLHREKGVRSSVEVRRGSERSYE